MRSAAACFYLFSFLFLTSCVVEEPDLRRYVGAGIDNVETTKDVKLIYTDSSRITFTMSAPVSNRRIDRYSVIDEFPEGVSVVFYDKSETPISWLDSKYALRDQANRKIYVRDSVVLKNSNGEKIEGPELIWDEKSHQIYTDRFVKITRQDGTIAYSYGINSNENFTRYQLNAVAGDLNMASVSDSSATDSVPPGALPPPPTIQPK